MISGRARPTWRRRSPRVVSLLALADAIDDEATVWGRDPVGRCLRRARRSIDAAVAYAESPDDDWSAEDRELSDLIDWLDALAEQVEPAIAGDLTRLRDRLAARIP